MKEVQRVTDELAVRNAALEKAQRELTELESQMARYENQTSTLISKEDVSSTRRSNVTRDSFKRRTTNFSKISRVRRRRKRNSPPDLRSPRKSALCVAKNPSSFKQPAADAERAKSEAESKRAALEEEITRIQAEVEKAQALRTEAERAKAEAEGRRELALRAVEEEQARGNALEKRRARPTPRKCNV